MIVRLKCIPVSNCLIFDELNAVEMGINRGFGNYLKANTISIVWVSGKFEASLFELYSGFTD